MKKAIVVAAMSREISPLLRRAIRSTVEAQRRRIELYETENALYAFGGIGVISARVAADAAYKHLKGDATCFISAGFAGALIPELSVGDVVRPAVIINETDEVKAAATTGRGVLVTSGAIATRDHKRSLAARYAAQAVDMEAYAVADVASIYRLPVFVIKAISDELEFAMPPMGKFVRDDGSFSTASLLAYAAIRPWTWPSIVKLSTNAAAATAALCREVAATIEEQSKTMPDSVAQPR